jgi:hypothetical protein
MKVVFVRCISKLFKLIDSVCAKEINTKFVKEGCESLFAWCIKNHFLLLNPLSKVGEEIFDQHFCNSRLLSTFK